MLHWKKLYRIGLKEWDSFLSTDFFYVLARDMREAGEVAKREAKEGNLESLEEVDELLIGEVG